MPSCEQYHQVELLKPIFYIFEYLLRLIPNIQISGEYGGGRR